MSNIAKAYLTALAISLAGTSLALAQAPDPKGLHAAGALQRNLAKVRSDRRRDVPA